MRAARGRDSHAESVDGYPSKFKVEMRQVEEEKRKSPERRLRRDAAGVPSGMRGQVVAAARYRSVKRAAEEFGYSQLVVLELWLREIDRRVPVVDGFGRPGLVSVRKWLDWQEKRAA